MSEESDLVTVFATGNPALVALAKAFLDGAEIRYVVRNEAGQNLFGLGLIGTGFNLVIGLVEIQVLERDAEAARELLAELESDHPTDTEPSS